MLYKICRICTNDASWKHPTIKENENPESFTALYGFGYEEWLNRKEWAVSGFSDHETWRYIHIPSLLTIDNKYKGENLTVFLYTKKRGKQPEIVGMIYNLKGIAKEEAEWAMAKYQAEGWADIMKQEVNDIGGDSRALAFSNHSKKHENWTPLWFANVKFSPNNLVIFQRPIIISELSSYYYSTALNCNNDFLNTMTNSANIILKSATTTKTQVSEAVFITRAIKGKEIHPKQAPIQNSLYKQLDKFYTHQGGEVLLESNNVDLTLNFQGKTTLIEIKPAPSAKQAIRLAIGQLLEYAHYPSKNAEKLLVIVSDVKLENDDKNYLKLLNEKYKLPVKYIFCSKSTKLSEEELLDFFRKADIVTHT